VVHCLTLSTLHSLETFAESRGFTKGELEEYEIRLDGDEVIIPTLGRRGAWYERRYRPGKSPKYLSPADVPNHLYNPLGLGPGAEVVWLAEGEFDCLSLVVSGAPAVGVLGAGSFRREWALLFRHARVIVAFDPDMEGDSQAAKVMGLWPEGRARRFRVPEPYEDLNDWFVRDYDAFEKEVKAWSNN
jgi:hypothetical protein